MKMLTHRQQLRLIEGLAILWEDSDRSHNTAERIIADIYKFAHVNGSCKNPHYEWHKDGFKLGKRLKETKITDINR